MKTLQKCVKPKAINSVTVRIENLQRHTDSIEDLSVTHFDLWGPLTSRNTLEEYQRLLECAVAADGLPSTLVAEENRAILGSVNVLDSDLPIRSDLTPWLAQLFVFPEYRSGDRLTIGRCCYLRGAKA